MLGIGTAELLVIGLIIVIFYGPDRLPQLLSKVNRVFNDIRHAGNDVKQQLGREIAKVESDIVSIEQAPHLREENQNRQQDAEADHKQNLPNEPGEGG